jgi:hypothetical protein
MFGYVRAKRPYGEHQSYEMPGIAIEIVSRQPVSAEMQRWIDRRHTFRTFYKLRTTKQVQAALDAIAAEVSARDPSLGVVGVRLFFAAFQAPAYPAPAALTRVPLGVLGEQLEDGRMTSALSKVTARGDELVITPRWTNVAPRAVKYEVVIDYATTPVPLEILGDERARNSAVMVRARRPPGSSLLVLAIVGGTRYVVGEVGKRPW